MMFNQCKLNSSQMNVLAFDNLTYESSNEDDDQQEQIRPMINSKLNDKKTIKSIKRKDRLKKFQPMPMQTNDESAVEQDGEDRFKSMPDLLLIDDNDDDDDDEQSEIKNCLAEESDNDDDDDDGLRELEMRNKIDYERNLKRRFRNDQSISRSLRKAKYIYYRTLKSKSLEELNLLDRITYMQKTVAKLSKNLVDTSATSCCNLTAGGDKQQMARTSSVNSLASSAAVSIGHLSNFSGSFYFHELSDWTPELDLSDSYTSDEENDVCLEFVNIQIYFLLN